MSSITLNFNNRKDIEFVLSLLRRMQIHFEVAAPIKRVPNPKDAAVDALFGSWESDLSADEMVDMIYEGRINKTIDGLSQFFKQHIKLSTLKNKDLKHRYIRFLSKLTEMREVMELETGKISIEEIELVGKNFAKKMQDPIGVF